MLKKKIIAVMMTALLLAGLLASTVTVSAEGYPLPEGQVVYSEAAILVNLAGDQSGDMVVYEKNADAVHAPGSMMRYMVLAYALHLVQEKDLDIDKVTGEYTVDMFNNFVAGTGVPTVNMNYGEKWTLRDLMAVSFMQAASDAVTVLAVTLAGNVNDFVKGMNELAVEIGCEYSHFSNLTGLDSLSQYTTARDMYRIVRYCQSFSEFEDLAVQYQVTVKPKAGGTERTLVSTNSLLQPSSTYRYSPIVHSRTGLSEHEGRACASVARDSGYEYLVVVIGCPEETADGTTGLHYLDTISLLKWAFNGFSYQTILGKSRILASLPLELAWDTDHVNLVPAAEVATVVDNKLDMEQIIPKVTLYEDSVTAPVEKGTVLGKVELIINVDQKIGEVDLVVGESIGRSWLLYAWSRVSGFFTSIWFLLGILLLILLLVGYIILNIVHNRNRRRQRLQRVKRQ